MRVLLAVHHFPPNYTGGAEWEAYRIASRLIDRSHQVQVLCVENVTNGKKESISWEDDFYKGVPVRRLFLNMKFAFGEFTSWEFDNPLIGQMLNEFLLEYKPDIFHLMSGYILTGRCLRVAKELNIPTVLSLMDFWFLCRRITMLRSDGKLSGLPISPVVCAQCIGEEKKEYKLLGKIFPKMMELYWKGRKSVIRLFEERQAFSLDTLNSVDVIISRSKFMLDFYIRAGVKKNRLVLSRQGQDIDNIQVENSILNEDSRKLRIGYLGQIAPVKGIHILINALGLIKDKDVKLFVYGNESAFPQYSGQLRQLAKEDSRIEFVGQFRRDELRKVMQGLDVIVVPSLWYENSPNVIQEAFMYRVPVIASDLGGMAELITHKENGLLFQPGDIIGLADQIKLLFESPDLLGRLKRGIEPVKTVETEINELERIYASVLHQGPGM
jgi:glycosyltransferase involved in cell wall biosynthesis